MHLCCFGRNGRWYSVYEPAYARFALEELKEEVCVRFTAEVIREERSRSGYDLHLLEVEILSEPEEVPPVVINQRRVNTSIENLLDYRPITLRNEKERASFPDPGKDLSGVPRISGWTALHRNPHPKLVAAGAEGGANIFSLSYFGEQAYLAQSPQFYKQMMVGVFERVYEIAPVFRAEKHDTARHLNEYTSVDFEIGYIENFEDIMAMEQEMLRYTFARLQETCGAELSLLKAEVPVITEIPRIRFSEAKELVSRVYKRAFSEKLDFELRRKTKERNT